MKRIIVMVFACVFLFNGTSYATLIAHYTFDGTFDDVSGNGNNGTPYGGATLTEDRFGNPDSAAMSPNSSIVYL